MAFIASGLMARKSVPKLSTPQLCALTVLGRLQEPSTWADRTPVPRTCNSIAGLIGRLSGYRSCGKFFAPIGAEFSVATCDLSEV